MGVDNKYCSVEPIHIKICKRARETANIARLNEIIQK